MDAISNTDRLGDRQKSIDARADMLQRIGYGANLILQCDPTDQKDVIKAFKEKGGKDFLAVSYDMSDLEAKFNEKFGSIVGTDIKQGDYWWSDYDKMFAVFVIEELTGEMVKSASETGTLGFLAKRRVAGEMKNLKVGYEDGMENWDKMIVAVRNIRKEISKKGPNNVKFCFSGVDRIPPDEQPAAFDYISRFSKIAAVDISFLASDIPHAAEYYKNEKAVKGIPYDRVTLRGFGVDAPAPIYVEPKKLHD